MNKIKFNLEEQKNKVVKFGGQKIKIRPYILTNEKVMISDICSSQFYDKDKKEKSESLHLIRLLFEMITTQLCTNIDVEGVELKYKGDKLSSILVNIKENTIEEFEKSCISSIVKDNVADFETVWENVVSDIKSEATTSKILDVLNSFVPSGEKQENMIKEISETLNNFAKEHPQEVKDAVLKPIQESARKELKENKKSKK